MSAVSSLLDSLIDYAGLFPPAQLALTAAMQEYAAYLAGPNRAALGRFVLPIANLAEFERAFTTVPAGRQTGWRLSILASGDPARDAEIVSEFNCRQVGAQIVAVEAKATTPEEIAGFTNPFPRAIEVWVELPATASRPSALLEALRAAGRGAKLRMGGITTDAFPSPAEVARFLGACRRSGVVMKATAGLHHPLRGDYRLTYEPGSPNGRMFGFLNVFLAAALVHAGGADAEVLALLEESDARAFTVTPEALMWRDHRFTAAQLAAARRGLCRSFGSCSFTEPVEGLQQLHWL